MKKFISAFGAFLTLITIALLLSAAPADAQYREDPDWGRQGPAQPTGNPGGPPQLPGAPTQTPIGSGLGLLLAAGGAYALKKLKQKPE